MTLVLELMPIIVIGIIIIIAFLTFNAKKTITEVSCMDLQAETNSNAYNIETGFRMLTAKFGQYCDTMEQLSFETHDDLLKYIEPSAKYTAVENTGIFVGFSDDSYIFANHTKEDDSWKPTEQPWYKAGIGHETFVETAPAVDPVNNKLCISFVRQNDFFNGEVGVCGTNVYLSDIQAAVNELTPMKMR
ncbi:methyl-accepting chemotaxis protein [Lachnospiraceae bacterium C7]|nr:methyl-accepting chemotaxis protein [Lachnospiraceae bacterium C7]